MTKAKETKTKLPWEEGLTPVQQKQTRVPEAMSSITVDIKTPTGFVGLLTIRSDDEMDLFERWLITEMFLGANGYEPHQKYGKGSYKRSSAPKKPIEHVPNRMCPTCGAQLVYFEKPSNPGVKHIKCSTQKWDPVNKRAMGCNYVEWTNQAQPDQTFPTVTLPPPPTAPPVTQPVTQGVKPASPSQVKLIQDKWPTLYREGLSMTEAYAIIKNNFSK